MNDRKIAGIVCEYNPFHTGHEYQIKKIREMGYEKIVCVMSGNTVQRGELAVADKYARAKMAIDCGADLVLELPYPYSSSGAEFFATAAVKILSSAGVGTLCFGSESADVDALTSAAKVCESDVFAEKYRALSSDGLGTASAYFEAYKQVADELGVSADKRIEGSNDLLGVAYIRAISRYGIDMTPIAIKREGSAYTDGEIDESCGYPSALMIRNALGEGLGKIEKSMPRASFETLSECIAKGDAPCDIKKIESAVLAFFRLADAEILAGMNIGETGGGLAERLCKCSKAAKSYDELVALASGKKYTESRVRRAILACMTGATDEDIRRTPSYSTVLAFNDSGREVLASLRKAETEIAFVTKPADAASLSARATRQSLLSEKADALFTLAKPKASENGEYFTKSPYII